MLRHEKIQEAIRREVSSIIHDELNDPRVGFVTITKVDLAQDIRNATIFFSVLGSDDEHDKSQQALDSAAGFVRRLIAQRIKLRFTPEIIFRSDRSIEHSSKIEEILNKLKDVDDSARKINDETKDEIKNEVKNKRKETKVEPKKINRKYKKA